MSERPSKTDCAWEERPLSRSSKHELARYQGRFGVLRVGRLLYKGCGVPECWFSNNEPSRASRQWASRNRGKRPFVVFWRSGCTDGWDAWASEVLGLRWVLVSVTRFWRFVVMWMDTWE